MPQDPTTSREISALEHAEVLFAFLQGKAPNGYDCSPMPHLDPETAWTVLWFIQSQHHQYGDHIDRCEVCGLLYNSEAEGDCLDFGDPPYSFCGQCEGGPEYEEKKAADPDRDPEDVDA